MSLEKGVGLVLVGTLILHFFVGGLEDSTIRSESWFWWGLALSSLGGYFFIAWFFEINDADFFVEMESKELTKYRVFINLFALIFSILLTGGVLNFCLLGINKVFRSSEIQVDQIEVLKYRKKMPSHRSWNKTKRTSIEFEYQGIQDRANLGMPFDEVDISIKKRRITYQEGALGWKVLGPLFVPMDD